MSLRRGLILNIAGLALVVALTASAVTAISERNREINSLENKLCAAGGVCYARVQSLIEGWLLLLSTVALALIAAGTWMLYIMAVRLSRG